MKERPCGTCGEGMIRPRNVRGMVMDHRDDPAVRVRSDLVLPVCNVCGETIFTKESARELDEALEASYVAKRRKMQRALINDLRKRGFTQRQIESFASVSPGYLSKLRKGKIASGSTFRLLYLLHEMPDQVMATITRLYPRVTRSWPEAAAQSG